MVSPQLWRDLFMPIYRTMFDKVKPAGVDVHFHSGDNHGPPTPDEVRGLLEKARRELPGVTVRMGRLSDFADAILEESPELPVVRGDMPDTWIHGIMSMAVEKPNYRLGRLGSIVDPTQDVVRGSNFDVFCLASGMTVRGSGGECVGLCPIDSPLVSIGRPVRRDTARGHRGNIGPTH